MRLVRTMPALLPLVAAAALSACYVVPIDPRTGQPLPPYASPPLPPPAPPLPAPPPGPTLTQARLYPVNEAATQTGVLRAQIVDHHDGRGTLSLAYRGQTLAGEATRVDAGHAGFGRLHERVLGAARRDWSGRRGIANAAGGGIVAQCEYLLSAAALGTGVCVFSDGAAYQLHIGP